MGQGTLIILSPVTERTVVDHIQTGVTIKKRKKRKCIHLINTGFACGAK